jgi:uncharacterized protein (DUF58 family)
MRFSKTPEKHKPAHYGIERRHLVSGWPSLSSTHDAAYNAMLNAAGLVTAWRFYTERFTPAGRWFLLVTAIFFGYGTASLELQGYVPLAYLTALWIAALWFLVWGRPHVSLQARHAGRIRAGDILPVEVEIEQRDRGAGRDLRVLPHRLPPGIEAVPDCGVVLPLLKRGQKGRVTLGLCPERRGIYRLQGFRVETDFPFGLLPASRTFKEDRSLLVYPRFTPLSRVAIPVGRRYQPGGVAMAAARGESLEYIGNRDYRQGDNIRDIDWRATARLSRPIVREYREEYLLRVAVILDTHVPSDAASQQSAAFERAVSLCAAVGDHMAQQDYLVDILAAGPNLYHLTIGRSLAYLDQILDILACVEESRAEPFQVLEPEILESLAQITTIVCIFLDWTESRRAFVHRLSEQGAALKVIVVRDVSCSLDPAAEVGWLGHIPVISGAELDTGIEEL